MSETPIAPICAYDIWPDGQARPAPDHLPAPAGGAAYRWIHVDLADPGLSDWCARGLPALATRTLLAPRTRPRVDGQEDGLVVTLRGINLNDGAEVEDMVSLRMWLTERLVISVRKLRIVALDDLRAQIDGNAAPASPAHLLARITEALVERIETVSLDLEDRAELLEEEVYEKDNDDIDELAPLRRSVITLRRHIGPLSDALTDLAQIDSPLIPASLRHRLRDTANRAKRSVDEVHEVVDRLTALNDHLDIAQATRIGRNGYVLSVIAAIFLPLGFLTGLFGVNVGGMPGTDHPLGFIYLSVAMVAIGLATYLVLRLIRWF